MSERFRSGSSIAELRAEARRSAAILGEISPVFAKSQNCAEYRSFWRRVVIPPAFIVRGAKRRLTATL
jgi:hypothetical protein